MAFVPGVNLFAASGCRHPTSAVDTLQRVGADVFLLIFRGPVRNEMWLCIAPVILAVGESRFGRRIDQLNGPLRRRPTTPLRMRPFTSNGGSGGVAMYEWSEEQQAIIAVVRRFVDEEIRPHLDDLEHNGVPPYEILRKMYDTFGSKAMAQENFARQLERKISAATSRRESRTSDPAAHLIPTIELCRVEPGARDLARRLDGSGRGHHQQARYARADAALGARPHDPREDRRVGDHRTGLRF